MINLSFVYINCPYLILNPGYVPGIVYTFVNYIQMCVPLLAMSSTQFINDKLINLKSLVPTAFEQEVDVNMNTFDRMHTYNAQQPNTQSCALYNLQHSQVF